MSDKCPKCKADISQQHRLNRPMITVFQCGRSYWGERFSDEDCRDGDTKDCLRRQLAKLQNERDVWKEQANEYAATLQPLIMNTLYEPCRPVSHGWPGKPHVMAIVEGVNKLLTDIAAANERAEKAEAIVANWPRLGDGELAVPGMEVRKPGEDDAMFGYVVEMRVYWIVNSGPSEGAHMVDERIGDYVSAAEQAQRQGKT